MTIPFVLLHGFTGSPDSFRRVVGLLPDGTEVVAPVLVGHEEAGERITARGFESEVDRLAALLRQRGGRFHLVGYSLGGRLAVGLLVRHPELFERATLIGAQPGLESDDARADRLAGDEEWCRVLEERGIAAFVEKWQVLPLFATQARLPGDVLAEQGAERLRRDPFGLARSLRATGLGCMPSYWNDLYRIQVPTTLVVGSEDAKFLAIARRMADRLPRVGMEVVSGVGHNVVLECPEGLARILRRRDGHAPPIASGDLR